MTAPNQLEPFGQAELYHRGGDTLLASWEEYARGAAGAAAVHRLPGVVAAVFPDEPERAVYNNALLERDLGAGDRAGALDAMEAVYAAVGMARFAAWVHESDPAMRAELERRGRQFVDERGSAAALVPRAADHAAAALHGLLPEARPEPATTRDG